MVVKVVGFDESVKKQITCRNCGARNEYTPNDVQTLYKGKDISGQYEETKGFNCGNCLKPIITQSI